MIITMGEDGNIILFDSIINKQSKIIDRDEILATEILLKQQVDFSILFKIK